MPKGPSIRFGVGDGQHHCAVTWKLWTAGGSGKSDVYLVCRSLGAALKASLHESGYWHVAYSENAFENDVRGAIEGQTDKYLQRWVRPKRFAPGCTLAFRVVTPYTAVTSPARASDKDVEWIPNAPEPLATEICIIITSPHTSTTAWPGKRSMKTLLVGSFDLDSGETVWVVHRALDMPDLSSSGKAQFYKGRGPADLDSDDVRALVFGIEQDGSRVIYDLPKGEQPRQT